MAEEECRNSFGKQIDRVRALRNGADGIYNLLASENFALPLMTHFLISSLL